MGETKYDAAHAASHPPVEPAPPASDRDLFSSAGDIAPTALDRIEPTLEMKSEPAAADVAPPQPGEPIAPAATILGDSRPSLLRRYGLLAASVAAAMALGGFLGAAVTLELARGPAFGTAGTAAISAADESRALKETVSRLSGELGKLKASVETANRGTTAQLGKLTERLDRAEKVAAEPAAKLAKLNESVERLERHPAPSTSTAANTGSDITGSLATTEKPPARPPVAEGWYVLDFYAGRALVESRNGTLYEVGPGSSLPGLGRVESVKRQDGQVTVVTAKGIISAALETRRPSRYMPYRY